MATSKKPKASRSTRASRAGSRSIAPGSTDTRLALLRAAERLMADRGIDMVSLREVSAAAGQHNNSAVAYHFGTRDALIDAILERHSRPIHERWSAQLDFIERQGVHELRPLVEMLVVEIVRKLDDEDGGWEYLSICGQLLVTPRNPLTDREASRTPAVQRLIVAMLPFYAVPEQLLPLRFDRLASTLYTSLLSWRRREHASNLAIDRAVFVSELIDALVALITQPLSSETRARLAQADDARCAPESKSTAVPGNARRKRST